MLYNISLPFPGIGLERRQTVVICLKLLYSFSCLRKFNSITIPVSTSMFIAVLQVRGHHTVGRRPSVSLRLIQMVSPHTNSH